MTARRLARVEAAAGVGRTVWAKEARGGLALALGVMGQTGPDVEAVRLAFAVFHLAHWPGAGRRDMEEAGDALLDRLAAQLDGPTFNALLCGLACPQ